MTGHPLPLIQVLLPHLRVSGSPQIWLCSTCPAAPLYERPEGSRHVSPWNQGPLRCASMLPHLRVSRGTEVVQASSRPRRL